MTGYEGYDYFGFISGADYFFDDHYAMNDTLVIEEALVLLEDENGHGSLVTFNLRALKQVDGLTGFPTDEILETEIEFAAGTFPLPHGLDQAYAEEVILDSFYPSLYPKCRFGRPRAGK